MPSTHIKMKETICVIFSGANTALLLGSKFSPKSQFTYSIFIRPHLRGEHSSWSKQEIARPKPACPSKSDKRPFTFSQQIRQFAIQNRCGPLRHSTPKSWVVAFWIEPARARWEVLRRLTTTRRWKPDITRKELTGYVSTPKNP